MSINKNGYRKEKPLDAVLLMKVRSILQLILEKKIIDLDQLTEELKVDIK